MTEGRPRTRRGRRQQEKAIRSHRSAPRLLRVEVALVGTAPPVTRTLELASSLCLADLHHILQGAFEWDYAHLHDFSTQTRRWEPGQQIRESAASPFGAPSEPEESTFLLEVLGKTGDTVVYTYDFGDDWAHIITTVEAVPFEKGTPLARLIAAEGAAPFEDCGGIPGWEDLVAALSGPDPEGLREWANEIYGDLASFDPHHVDLDTLAQRVERTVSR